MERLWLFLIALAAYIIGSFPTGYVLVKLKTGKDIRRVGSGSTGGTNTARLLGWRYGVLVALVDILKCFILVFVFSKVISSEWVIVVVILAVTLGHIFPCFIRFKGGKGVSTIVGGLILLLSWMWLPLAAVWTTVLLSTKKMSLTNLVSVVLLPLFLWISQRSLVYVAFGILAIFIIYFSHRENIGRLLRGREPNAF